MRLEIEIIIWLGGVLKVGGDNVPFSNFVKFHYVKKRDEPDSAYGRKSLSTIFLSIYEHFQFLK